MFFGCIISCVRRNYIWGGGGGEMRAIGGDLTPETIPPVGLLIAKRLRGRNL